MHRLGGEFRPEYIFPTNPFVQGNNTAGQPIDLSLSGHLRYSFQFRPGSLPDRIYGGAYQGIGVAYYDFGNPDELGNPVAAYPRHSQNISGLRKKPRSARRASRSRTSPTATPSSPTRASTPWACAPD